MLHQHNQLTKAVKFKAIKFKVVPVDGLLHQQVQ